MAALLLSLIACASAFSRNHVPARTQQHHLSTSTSLALHNGPTEIRNDESSDDESSFELCSRRSLLVQSLGVAIALGSSLSAAQAADDTTTKKTVYLTGKTPVVPGQKPKDKGDVSGTRKDPNFLRSISDCKSQCENKTGPDGLAKSKEDCLSECQDICCTTYEQCTFAIVPRI